MESTHTVCSKLKLLHCNYTFNSIHIIYTYSTNPKHLNKVMISKSKWDVGDMKSLWTCVPILYGHVRELKLMCLLL